MDYRYKADAHKRNEEHHKLVSEQRENDNKRYQEKEQQ